MNVTGLGKKNMKIISTQTKEIWYTHKIEQLSCKFSKKTWTRLNIAFLSLECTQTAAVVVAGTIENMFNQFMRNVRNAKRLHKLNISLQFTYNYL